MIRIGIDGRALTGRYTGDRTYWLNLLREHIAAAESGDRRFEYVVYSRLPISEDLLPASPRVQLRTLPSANDRLWTLWAYPRALREDRIDVAHTQYTTPVSAPCPVITTVHDISFRLYPEWYPRKHRVLLNLTVPVAMRRASRVLTVSESSRRDMLRVYGLREDQVVATPLAAPREYAPVPKDDARAAVKAAYGIDGPYVLSVGVLQPRKNLRLLLEAFASARSTGKFPHRLVITGKRGWGFQGLLRTVQQWQIADAVTFTDYVPDADLPALYSAAGMMAYPSMYEGFGLPPLEAMACGAPTLVSDQPAMPEVAGDGAWVLPVVDAEAWARAMLKVAADEEMARCLGSAGRKRAARFSWADTAGRTREIYEQATRREATT